MLTTGIGRWTVFQAVSRGHDWERETESDVQVHLHPEGGFEVCRVITDLVGRVAETLVAPNATDVLSRLFGRLWEVGHPHYRAFIAAFPWIIGGPGC